jgi:hypothetical protein
MENIKQQIIEILNQVKLPTKTIQIQPIALHGIMDEQSKWKLDEKAIEKIQRIFSDAAALLNKAQGLFVLVNGKVHPEFKECLNLFAKKVDEYKKYKKRQTRELNKDLFSRIAREANKTPHQIYKESMGMLKELEGK